MRFTLLAAPGSDPGVARARASAVIAVDGAPDVAAAARAAADPYLLLLAAGARPLAAAFGGLNAALATPVGVLGGATHTAGARLFGWTLAAAPASPLRFEAVPLAGGPGEGGEIDVVAPGMVLAARELLIEPLPSDPLAALVELCARAREAGLAVVCRPAFACEAPGPGADDRGRVAALRELAERRPDLRAALRSAPLAARAPRPAITMLVHGAGGEAATRTARALSPRIVAARAVTDPVAALRREMRVRGDRYVLIADAATLPDAAGVAVLVDALEATPPAALAAPDSAGAAGGCALLALGRFPQHVEAEGRSIGEALASLCAAATRLRRAVRVPGRVAAADAPAPRGRATIVLLAASIPEIMRLSLDAVVGGSRPGDELIAVCAAKAATARRLFAAYPQFRLEADESDPVLAEAANRAIGGAAGDVIVLVADDVLLPAGTLERLRAAFERIPSLGAAFAAIPGAPDGEGVQDAAYADVAEMRALAERRARERARELVSLEIAGSPALAVAREAFAAVGGIDPADGPTRRGIAALVARLRAAGYGVVRCDDALAHRFAPSLSQSPIAAASAQQAAPNVDPAAVARGFDPARRIPFERSGAAAPTAVAVAIALSVGDAAELEDAARFLTAAAAIFDAGSPVRVHLLLDGSVAASEAVARIRPALSAGGKPLEETLAVRVERSADLGAWRAGLEPGIELVVAAGHERAALAGLAVVQPRALRELLRARPR